MYPTDTEPTTKDAAKVEAGSTEAAATSSARLGSDETKSEKSKTSVLNSQGVLNTVLGVGAIVISLSSLVVAIQQTHTMEKTVQASTWPYVDFGRSDANAQGDPVAILTLVNTGVGPARVESVEVFVGDKPVSSRSELAVALTELPGPPDDLLIINSRVTDRVLPPGEPTAFFTLKPTATGDSPAFITARSNIAKVSVRVCYCSALDACWVRDSRRSKPEPADKCPATAVPYEKRP